VGSDQRDHHLRKHGPARDREVALLPSRPELLLEPVQPAAAFETVQPPVLAHDDEAGEEQPDPATLQPERRIHTIYNATNTPRGSGTSGANASPIVMAIAIAIVVLAAGVVGYLATTFLFAFSSSQGRMVPVVNLGAVSVLVSSLVVAAVTWVFRSPTDALKWTAIGTAVGWLAATAIEFALSFSLG
jgi:hypothetical protein